MGTKLYLFFIGIVISYTAIFSMEDSQLRNGSLVSSSSDNTARTTAVRFSSHDHERQPLIVKDLQSDAYHLTIQPEHIAHDTVRRYEIKSDISKKVFVLGVCNTLWKLGAAGTFAWYIFYQQAGQ